MMWSSSCGPDFDHHTCLCVPLRRVHGTLSGGLVAMEWFIPLLDWAWPGPVMHLYTNSQFPTENCFFTVLSAYVGQFPLIAQYNLRTNVWRWWTLEGHNHPSNDRLTTACGIHPLYLHTQKWHVAAWPHTLTNFVTHSLFSLVPHGGVQGWYKKGVSTYN